jgi:hypothetical protein
MSRRVATTNPFRTSRIFDVENLQASVTIGYKGKIAFYSYALGDGATGVDEIAAGLTGSRTSMTRRPARNLRAQRPPATSIVPKQPSPVPP